jgi:hypothetical protein
MSKIYIYVSGGLVQGALCTDDKLEVHIIDCDIIKQCSDFDPAMGASDDYTIYPEDVDLPDDAKYMIECAIDAKADFEKGKSATVY